MNESFSEFGYTLICPYCRYAPESKEWEEKLSWIIDNVMTIECESCHKKYIGRARIEFHSRKSCKVNSELHDYIKKEDLFLDTDITQLYECKKCGDYKYEAE